MARFSDVFGGIRMLNNYVFSTGRGLTSVEARTVTVDSFEALFSEVVEKLGQKNASPQKGASAEENRKIKNRGFWFACAFSGEKRKKENALARAFVILDIDKCEKQHLSKVSEFCHKWNCFTYESFSSTESAPRFRIVFNASRPILSDELSTVTRFIADELTATVLSGAECCKKVDAFTVEEAKEDGTRKTSFEVDPCSGQLERIFLTPPMCFAGRSRLYTGALLDVEEALKNAPETPKKPHKGKKAGEKEAHALTRGIDPIVSILKEKGLLGREIESGKWSCKCAFDDEHTTPYGGENDTSCVFFEAGSKVSDGVLPYGVFKCQHGHCSGREQFEFFQKIGVSFVDYQNYMNGNTESRFKSASSGVTYYIENGVLIAETIGKDGETRKNQVCDKLTIKALSTSKDGAKPILWIELFNSQTGQTMLEPLPQEELFSLTGEALMRRLTSKGLYARKFKGAGGLNYIVDYLRNYPRFNMKPLISVDRVGWFDIPKRITGESKRVFVTPEESFGEAGGKALYIGDKSGSISLSVSGTLEEWRENVARFASLSSRIRFAIGCAFSAPCLKILGLEGGGFNLSGSSSKGKSTAQIAGASVYGNPEKEIKPWHATGTAIEVLANGHNDLLLCLDEGGTADGRSLINTCYILSNGYPKARGKVDGGRGGEIGARELPTPWHVLTLSTSELTVTDMVRELAKQDATAGQIVRLIDIPAVATPERPEWGIFESTGEYPDTGTIALTLKENARRFHGAVGREWLKYLSENTQESIELLQRHREVFEERFYECVKTDLSSQGKRALQRFSLVYASSCLASQKGFTGWTIEGIQNDLIHCALTALKSFSRDFELENVLKKLNDLLTVKERNFSDFREYVLRHGVGDSLGLLYFANSEYKPALGVSDLLQINGESVRVALINTPIFEKLVKPLSRNDSARMLEKAEILKVCGKRQGSAVGLSAFMLNGIRYHGYIILHDRLLSLIE